MAEANAQMKAALVEIKKLRVRCEICKMYQAKYHQGSLNIYITLCVHVADAVIAMVSGLNAKVNRTSAMPEFGIISVVHICVQKSSTQAVR